MIIVFGIIVKCGLVVFFYLFKGFFEVSWCVYNVVFKCIFFGVVDDV